MQIKQEVASTPHQTTDHLDVDTGVGCDRLSRGGDGEVAPLAMELAEPDDITLLRVGSRAWGTGSRICHAE